MGFCLLNNVAIAAARRPRARASRAWRSSTGTCTTATGRRTSSGRDGRVLFVSLHEIAALPGHGRRARGGRGRGRGRIVLNVPLPAAATTRSTASPSPRWCSRRSAASRPSWCWSRAGFDAHARDPLASMQVTEAGYGWMARALREAAEETAGGRLGLVLEGGYDLTALEESTAASLRGALGWEVGEVTGEVPARHREAVEEVRVALAGVERWGGSGSGVGETGVRGRPASGERVGHCVDAPVEYAVAPRMAGRPGHGGYSSAGRALDCGSRCRGFEPRYSPQWEGPASVDENNAAALQVEPQGSSAGHKAGHSVGDALPLFALPPDDATGEAECPPVPPATPPSLSPYRTRRASVSSRRRTWSGWSAGTRRPSSLPRSKRCWANRGGGLRRRLRRARVPVWRSRAGRRGRGPRRREGTRRLQRRALRGAT